MSVGKGKTRGQGISKEDFVCSYFTIIEQNKGFKEKISTQTYTRTDFVHM